MITEVMLTWKQLVEDKLLFNSDKFFKAKYGIVKYFNI